MYIPLHVLLRVSDVDPESGVGYHDLVPYTGRDFDRLPRQPMEKVLALLPLTIVSVKYRRAHEHPPTSVHPGEVVCSRLRTRIRGVRSKRGILVAWVGVGSTEHRRGAGLEDSYRLVDLADGLKKIGNRPRRNVEGVTGSRFAEANVILIGQVVHDMWKNFPKDSIN